MWPFSCSSHQASACPVLDIAIQPAHENLESKERDQRSLLWSCWDLWVVKQAAKRRKIILISAADKAPWYHRIRVERDFEIFLQTSSPLLNTFWFRPWAISLNGKLFLSVTSLLLKKFLLEESDHTKLRSQDKFILQN